MYGCRALGVWTSVGRRRSRCRERVPFGTYTLRATASGFLPGEQSVEVEAQQETEVEIFLAGAEFPRTYVGTGTRKLFAEWDFLGGGSAESEQQVEVEATLKADGEVELAFSTCDGDVEEVPVIGGEPGETRTVCINNQFVEITCPPGSYKEGETVRVVTMSFVQNGQVGWRGEWLEDGTYDTHRTIVVFRDMAISGSFSDSRLTGRGAWPDSTQFPRGAEMSNFICSRSESTFFVRMEWDFTACAPEPCAE